MAKDRHCRLNHWFVAAVLPLILMEWKTPQPRAVWRNRNSSEPSPSHQEGKNCSSSMTAAASGQISCFFLQSRHLQRWQRCTHLDRVVSEVSEKTHPQSELFLHLMRIIHHCDSTTIYILPGKRLWSAHLRLMLRETVLSKQMRGSLKASPLHWQKREQQQGDYGHILVPLYIYLFLCPN